MVTSNTGADHSLARARVLARDADRLRVEGSAEQPAVTNLMAKDTARRHGAAGGAVSSRP